MRGFSWSGLWVPTWPPWEVALRAALVYGFIQLLLRLGGRKELGRYSTPDIVLLFLITTASRQTIVGNDTSLTSAFVGLATLVALDRLIGALALKLPTLARVLVGPPRPLVKDGRVLDDELRQAHISRDELLSHLRGKGKDRLEEVKAAFLEPDGRITFLFRSERAEVR